MMRKTPRFGGGGWAVAFLAMGAWLGLGALAWGRIGETQPEIEDHLTEPTAEQLHQVLTVLQKYVDAGAGQNGSGGGRRGGGGRQAPSDIIVVPDGFDFKIVDDLIRAATGQPPAAPAQYGVVSSAEFSMHNYFKTDDGSPAEGMLNGDLSQATGWEFQTYLYKGVSELEVYRRIGPDLTDPEINLLLALNQGQSNWQHASAQASTWEQKTDSFLGYDYVRADGKLRALKKANDLVIFSAALDQRLLDLMEKARQVQNTNGKSTAPSSVKGF
jgi:hypothetical protein